VKTTSHSPIPIGPECFIIYMTPNEEYHTRKKNLKQNRAHFDI